RAWMGHRRRADHGDDRRRRGDDRRERRDGAEGGPMMARRHPAIAQLLALVDEGFDRAAWHGPTLGGALGGVTARQAAWRAAGGSQHIRETRLRGAFGT